ncbi:transcription factor jun-D-like [Empidonax traillii]|uniref:transcription factor jun-D-like n=1 Tax=Empidonax traillii TaxID=164674 RepID=UPI000FFD51E6|nr:transcription factor jun-D-like [Empidonax traillii]
MLPDGQVFARWTPTLALALSGIVNPRHLHYPVPIHHSPSSRAPAHSRGHAWPSLALLPQDPRPGWSDAPRNPSARTKAPAAPPLPHRSGGASLRGGGAARAPRGHPTGKAFRASPAGGGRSKEGTGGGSRRRRRGGQRTRGVARSGGAGRRLSPRCQPRAAGPAEQPPSPARPAPKPPAGEGGSMSGGRSGRSAVKMEAPFYPEEGLELLPDFVPLPGFGTAGGPGADAAAAGQKLLLGAGKKRDLSAAAPAPLPGPFTLRPPAGARGSAAALRLLPPPPAAAPPPTAGSTEPGSGGGAAAAAARGGPEAALGSAAELPLLKLPPAADLEQLLIQGGAGLGAGSPGPAAPGAGSGGAAAAGPFLYRQPVTQEQEGFADGFVKALADLHKQNQLLAAPPPPLSAPGPCCTARPGPPGAPAAAAADPPAVYTNLSGFNPAGPLSPSGSAYSAASAPPPPPPGLAFGAAGLGSGRLPPARSLEEPQTVPEVPPSAGGEGGSSAPTPPSLSPLDAESQERLKAERKRLRNRIAASKCRRRKLERIARLEEKVKALKGQNAELAATANLLRAQVTQLQGRVRSHLSSGCHINAAGHPPPHAAAQPREAPPEAAAAAAPETSAC